jgi:uncharacterized membrane protein
MNLEVAMMRTMDAGKPISQHMYCSPTRHFNLPCVSKVGTDAPLGWLASGLTDFQRSWLHSFPYGIILSVAGLVMLYFAADQPYLMLALISGFMLVAPFLAAGLYIISMRLEWSETGKIGPRPEFRSALKTNVSLFGVLLAFVFAIWIDALIVFTALFTHHDIIISGSFSVYSLFNLDHLSFVLAYGALGALLAATAFCVSVITVPMMLDRDVDMVTAIMTSLVIVKENPMAMLIWAACIAALTFGGMITLFIGFAVVFPVLGHATWHAYRELVDVV